MNRTLLALASCAVLCAAASAQSSVTMFGVVDLDGRWLKPPVVPVGGAYDTLVRANSMVAYFTPPNLAGGLYGLLQVAAGEGTYGNKYYGGRLGYAAGPLDVNVGYGETLAADDTYADKFNLVGSWILGPVKVSGFYGRITGIDNKQDNWFVGASMPLGHWTLRASYGHA
jgi:predicted porin